MGSSSIAWWCMCVCVHCVSVYTCTTVQFTQDNLPSHSLSVAASHQQNEQRVNIHKHNFICLTYLFVRSFHVVHRVSLIHMPFAMHCVRYLFLVLCGCRVLCFQLDVLALRTRSTYYVYVRCSSTSTTTTIAPATTSQSGGVWLLVSIQRMEPNSASRERIVSFRLTSFIIIIYHSLESGD